MRTLSIEQIERALTHVSNANRATLAAESAQVYTAQHGRLYTAQHGR